MFSCRAIGILFNQNIFLPFWGESCGETIDVSVNDLSISNKIAESLPQLVKFRLRCQSYQFFKLKNEKSLYPFKLHTSATETKGETVF